MNSDWTDLLARLPALAEVPPEYVPSAMMGLATVAMTALLHGTVAIRQPNGSVVVWIEGAPS